MRSKVVFSPFGWGEVCFRDYEAVACGCLLVKPSMSHVATSPDIFVPDQTYVPVKWDFSDLCQKIEFYLSRPDEASRIAENAHRVLSTYYAHAGFVADVHRSLDGLVEMTADHATEALKAG
jgi:spore maturation protein CgeB